MKEVRNETPEVGESTEPTEDSPHPPPNTFQPGQVWWCDGITLAFDPYYKRRPVLIVGIEADIAHIIPLSSKRRYGQETAVTHEKGISYMAGSIRDIPATALLKPLGFWRAFPDWYESQCAISETPTPFWQSVTNFIQRIQKRLQTWLSNIDTLV